MLHVQSIIVPAEFKTDTALLVHEVQTLADEHVPHKGIPVLHASQFPELPEKKPGAQVHPPFAGFGTRLSAYLQ